VYLRFLVAPLSVSESIVDPSYDQLKLLPGLPESLSTRIDTLITCAHLPTADRNSYSLLGGRIGLGAPEHFFALAAPILVKNRLSNTRKECIDDERIYLDI